ncbi:hypothetical protein N0V90_003867 [Kalmusia sp. IMI 367209]|nr:hypothetical protein N0V90_003867 [Kalmusia sp. IMI 367209]
MAPVERRLGPTRYDLQPLEDALRARGLDGIYTRDFMEKLAEDTARLRLGTLSIADLKDDSTAPPWLRNALTHKVASINPGLRTYAGHWYNSYLRIAADGYDRGPDLLVAIRHTDGQISPPNYAFDPSKTCAPVQLTSYAPYRDDQLAQKQLAWAACNKMFRASKTRTLLQLQVTSQHLRSGAPRIHKVVCMGLGSLTRQVGGPDAWFRPYFQHIVALSIAQAFDDLYKQHPERYGQSSKRVRLLAQDPSYSESDKHVLADNGFTVLEDPNGLLAIDKNTLVMSAFPSFPLYEIIADMLPGGPAAIFDASLPTVFRLDSLMRYNEFAAPRVKQMLNGRLIYRLKWDEIELHRMNKKLLMAVHWLPRMKLFFEPSDGAAGGLSTKVIEDIQRREELITAMLPSGVQLLRQRLQRFVTD